MFESGKVRTELTWTGKKKKNGRLPKLPFQTVEIVNETRKRALDTYTSSPPPDEHNLLIWGDNKFVMNSLLKDFEGKINLIYIDPPFATGADFKMPIKINGDRIIKEPSGIEIKAYRDTWGQGLASYLQMMYDRLVLMRRLLAENGSIYVHMDWHVGHYVKIIMDEIFGKENFINEIIYHYDQGARPKTAFGHKHDSVYRYSKSQENWIFNYEEILVPFESGMTKWRYTRGGQRDKEMPKGKVPSDVWDIKLNAMAHEHLSFPTQKPEALLERIIKASSDTDKNNLIADFFCGSGTTLAVAEKLGRRWIGCDLSKYAVHVTKKRLLDLPGCKPFKIRNLGKYQKRKLIENGIKDYFEFILQLYGASSVSGYAHIHGRIGGKLVHVGTPDSFVTEREVKRALEECRSANSSYLDVLGWEFEMGLYELIEDIGMDYGVNVKLKQIPIDILDMREREFNGVKFFDLNYLDLDSKVKDRKVTIVIDRFVLANPEYIPDEMKLKDFSSYIDYWAVDFDYKGNGDAFHNVRQEYRTREHKNLNTKISYEYDKLGEYDILVKVVDILGNDTTKKLQVKAG